jgi:hypothetical protein
MATQDPALETKRLQALRKHIDAPSWWIGDNYEGCKQGVVAIHSPARGAIAELSVEGDEGAPIEGAMDNAELMSLAPDLLDEVLRLRKENEYLQQKLKFDVKEGA